MINIRMIYPLLAFKEKDKHIYCFRKNIGIASVGGEKFYKGLTIIDAQGMVYELKRSKIKGKAKFVFWLKYFQPMVELDLEFEKMGNLTLDELKEKIYTHIKSSPRIWHSLGPVNIIVEEIKKKTEFKDLIEIFE
jgi:hypothetical protein